MYWDRFGKRYSNKTPERLNCNNNVAMGESPRQGGYIAQMTSANRVNSLQSQSGVPTYIWCEKTDVEVGDKGVERHV